MKWRHNVQDIHPCKECDKIYKDYDQFKKHLLDVHQKEPLNQPAVINLKKLFQVKLLCKD